MRNPEFATEVGALIEGTKVGDRPIPPSAHPSRTRAPAGISTDGFRHVTGTSRAGCRRH
jgi:hypothetical protein